jgi:hypothetical protein
MSVEKELQQIRANQEEHNNHDDTRFEEQGKRLEKIEEIAIETREALAELTKAVSEVLELYRSFGTVKKTLMWIVGVVGGLALFISSWRTILSGIKDILK